MPSMRHRTVKLLSLMLKGPAPPLPPDTGYIGVGLMPSGVFNPVNYPHYRDRDPDRQYYYSRMRDFTLLTWKKVLTDEDEYWADPSTLVIGHNLFREENKSHGRWYFRSVVYVGPRSKYNSVETHVVEQGQNPNLGSALGMEHTIRVIRKIVRKDKQIQRVKVCTGDQWLFSMLGALNQYLLERPRHPPTLEWVLKNPDLQRWYYEFKGLASNLDRPILCELWDQRPEMITYPTNKPMRIWNKLNRGFMAMGFSSTSSPAYGPLLHTQA